MRLLYEFARSENLVGGAATRGVILHDERRFSAHEGGGDDRVVIVGAIGLGVFGRGL
jgi:hypothetical protein